MAKNTRPTSCATFAATSPAYMAARPASVTCKRLPNHKGDCRPTLIAPREAKPARVTRKPAKASKRADVTKLLAAIEAGTMTASEALSLLAAAAKPRASRKPASKPASVTTTAKPVVWGAKVIAANGVIGKVVRTSADVTEIMLADKSRKTFVTSTLTRI